MKLKRIVLSLMVMLCLFTAISPMQAEAAQEPGTIAKTRSVSLDTGRFYKVFHLDCGRKYFSAADIMAVIDTMAANDYTHLELAVGNGGLRFLLNDMSVTVDGKVYSGSNVSAAIHAGNTAFCDNGTNELTQSDMDAIIAYAGAKGIEILPLVNSPGHMNAVVTAMKKLGFTNPNYSGSSTTIDVSKAEVCSFSLALMDKYIQYFAGKGCTLFNMGADEYANDIRSQPQFPTLVSNGMYRYFVNYVNNVAALIQNAGMVPVAFNDGIYYNQNTSYGSFDQNIVISYWSDGWSGYNVAPASFLAAKGHKILNTNGNWYYVLNAANGTSWSSALSKIKSVPYHDVMGSKNVVPIGAMVCYWTDKPQYEYTAKEKEHVAEMISAFAAANPEVFQLGGQPDPEPEVPPISSEADVLLELTAGESVTQHNAKGYFTAYTNSDSAVASVTLSGGQDIHETESYQAASVLCKQLLSTNSTSWVKKDYYVSVNGSYYPLYVKRSSSTSGWFVRKTTYTYTYGYSANNGKSVTKLSDQSYSLSGSASDSTAVKLNLFVKTTGTEAVGYTDILITAKSAGVTDIKVGTTTYRVTVKAAPVEPVDPVEPVVPVEPVDPVEPVNPVDPVDPVEPVVPVDPVEPVEPVDPEIPVEPEIPTMEYANATLEINLVDYSNKSIAKTVIYQNGVKGTSVEFGTEEIAAQAKAILPAGYDFTALSALKNVKVSCGENQTVNVRIGKLATLQLVYKKSGKTVGTAVLTAVQTSKTTSYTFSTREIKAAAPKGYTAVSLFGKSVKFGASATLTVTCR